MKEMHPNDPVTPPEVTTDRRGVLLKISRNVRGTDVLAAMQQVLQDEDRVQRQARGLIGWTAAGHRLDQRALLMDDAYHMYDFEDSHVNSYNSRTDRLFMFPKGSDPQSVMTELRSQAWDTEDLYNIERGLFAYIIENTVPPNFSLRLTNFKDNS